tara:strand:+ start:1960 stop:2352 length:393 start_codon:yes stop_codon:yes gene_type:complete
MGYDAALPLVKDPTAGWADLVSAKKAVQQEFKILLLTTPGERVMDPEFGVGLKTYLFENLDRSTLGSIEAKIRKQTSRYLPYIEIRELTFSSALDSNSSAMITDLDENTISIKIAYSYGRGFFDEITVTP